MKNSYSAIKKPRFDPELVPWYKEENDCFILRLLTDTHHLPCEMHAYFDSSSGIMSPQPA
jgi:hypothetical protein